MCDHQFGIFEVVSLEKEHKRKMTKELKECLDNQITHSRDVAAQNLVESKQPLALTFGPQDTHELYKVQQ